MLHRIITFDEYNEKISVVDAVLTDPRVYCNHLISNRILHLVLPIEPDGNNENVISAFDRLDGRSAREVFEEEPDFLYALANDLISGLPNGA